MYSAKEVSEKLNVKLDTIYYWIKTNKVFSIKINYIKRISREEFYRIRLLVDKYKYLKNNELKECTICNGIFPVNDCVENLNRCKKCRAKDHTNWLKNNLHKKRKRDALWRDNNKDKIQSGVTQI